MTAPTTHAYGDDSPQQVFDLYVPPTRSARPHVVVAIHGGAFMMGDRTWELAALPRLLERGYAVASVEYRLSGEALFPAAVRDVKQAVAHLHAHAGELGIDTGFIAAWGRSAGGYLSAMLGATSGRQSEFEATIGSSRVDAVVDWYGPSDFSVMDEQFRLGPPTGSGDPVQDHDDPDSPESRFLGVAIQEAPELVARADPSRLLRDHPSPPPFFLAAGTNDRLVPHQQTLLVHEALMAHGAVVQLHLLDGASHADSRFEDELTGPAIDWLDDIRLDGLQRRESNSR